MGGRKGPHITAERPRAVVAQGPGHQGRPPAESLPPVSQVTRPNLGVGGGPGRGGEGWGRGSCCSACLFFLPSALRQPPAVWRPRGPGAAPVLSFLVWEVRGGGGRIKFTACHRWPPQLFTSTHCTHICLQFWNQSCRRPPPNTHSRPSSPKPVLPIFRAHGCWVQARQGLRRLTDQSQIQLSPSCPGESWPFFVCVCGKNTHT